MARPDLAEKDILNPSEAIEYVYTHIGFDDAEEELKRMEEFRKA